MGAPVARRRLIIASIARVLPRRRGAQTRQGAPALIRTMQNDKCRARAKSGPLMAIMTLLRPGGTAQGLGGGIPMGSTAPTGLFTRAQLPQAVWGWLSRPVSMLTISLDDFAPLESICSTRNTCIVSIEHDVGAFVYRFFCVWALRSKIGRGERTAT